MSELGQNSPMSTPNERPNNPRKLPNLNDGWNGKEVPGSDVCIAIKNAVEYARLQAIRDSTYEAGRRLWLLTPSKHEIVASDQDEC